MLDITKINYSQKKLSGKQHTWNTKKWYEEDDGILIFQHAKEIWIDRIDEVVPNVETKSIKPFLNLILKEDKTVQGRRSFYTTDTLGKKINGFIPPSYGIGYSVRLKIKGVIIQTSHSSNWIFDYVNGVLTFENTPPDGEVTIDVYQYIGRTFAQYLDVENNSMAMGILGINDPQLEYVIQHNMASYDVDTTVYVFDEVNGVNYWKKDPIPLILLDENRVKIQLTEKHPIRFIIKAYDTPNWG